MSNGSFQTFILKRYTLAEEYLHVRKKREAELSLLVLHTSSELGPALYRTETTSNAKTPRRYIQLSHPYNNYV
jgi:hypothetical protein